MVQGGTRVSLVQLLITPEETKVAHQFITAAPAPLVTASPTQGGVPLLQELHFHDLIDRRGVLQLIDESRHQVLVVAREDTQVVSRLVLQVVLVVCVQPHEYGGTTVGGGANTPVGEPAPF